MNEQAAAALVDAAMRAVPQIKGALFLGDGRCAGGVLIEAAGLRRPAEMPIDWDALCAWTGMDAVSRHACPHDCGMDTQIEWLLMVHLNNVHGDDFLTIARKLGP